jgi:hypothetical protein
MPNHSSLLNGHFPIFLALPLSLFLYYDIATHFSFLPWLLRSEWNILGVFGYRQILSTHSGYHV